MGEGGHYRSCRDFRGCHIITIIIIITHYYFHYYYYYYVLLLSLLLLLLLSLLLLVSYVFGAPSQGLDSSFCRRMTGRRLTWKECSFHRHRCGSKLHCLWRVKGNSWAQKWLTRGLTIMPAFSGSRVAHEWLTNGSQVAHEWLTVAIYGLKSVPCLFCRLSARAETSQKSFHRPVNTSAARHMPNPPTNIAPYWHCLTQTSREIPYGPGNSTS